MMMPIIPITIIILLLQECNSYLIMDTGDMWEKYVKRDFRTKVPIILTHVE